MVTMTLNPLTLCNVLVNLQLNILGDPSSVQLENPTAATTTTTATATTTVSLSAVFLTLYRTVGLYLNTSLFKRKTVGSFIGLIDFVLHR